MSLEFQPLTPQDFTTPDAYAEFIAAKERFMASDYTGWHHSDLPKSDALRQINATEDTRLRGRMAAELIQHTEVPELTKLRIATAVFFPKGRWHKDPLPTPVPFTETYLLLLKSKDSARFHYEETPRELTDYEQIHALLRASVGQMQVADQQKILELEAKHDADGVLSNRTSRILLGQLSQGLAETPYPEAVEGFAEQIRQSIQLDQDYAGTTYLLKNHIDQMPHSWSDETVKLQKKKRVIYGGIVRDGVTHYRQPVENGDRTTQRADFDRRIKGLVRLGSEHENVLQSDPKSARESLALMTEQSRVLWPDRANAPQKDAFPHDYELSNLFKQFKSSVTKTIHSGPNGLTAPDAANMLLDAKIAYHIANSYDRVGVSDAVLQIAEKASPENAVQVYASYAQKIPAIIKVDSNENNMWPVLKSIGVRLKEADRMPEQTRQAMLGTMLDVEEVMLQNTYGSSRNTGLTSHSGDVFEELKDAGKRDFLTVMAEKDYPAAASSDLHKFTRDAAKNSDPAIRQSACLLATRAVMNDVADPNNDARKKQDAAGILAGIYATVAEVGDRKQMRKLIRDYGEANGMASEAVNGVLQRARQEYKEKNGIVKRSKDIIAGLFGTTKNDLVGANSLTQRRAPALVA